MKKIILLISTIFISIVNVYAENYSGLITQTNSLISEMENAIIKLNSNNEYINKSYDDKISSIKNNLEASIIRVTAAFDRMWAWNSTASTSTINKMKDDADTTIQLLELERNTLIAENNSLIARSKKSIDGNTQILKRLELWAKISNISSEAEYYFETDLNTAILKLNECISLSKQDSFYDGMLKLCSDTKNKLIENNKEVNISKENELSYIATTAKEYSKQKLSDKRLSEYQKWLELAIKYDDKPYTRYFTALIKIENDYINTIKNIPTQSCKDNFWDNIYSDWVKLNNGWYNCFCNSWYEWGKDKKSCIKTINSNKEEIKVENFWLSEALKKKIDKFFLNIKNKISKLEEDKKIKYLTSLETKIDKAILKQKKEANKNILRYLNSLISEELSSLDDIWLGDLIK